MGMNVRCGPVKLHSSCGNDKHTICNLENSPHHEPVWLRLVNGYYGATSLTQTDYPPLNITNQSGPD